MRPASADEVRCSAPPTNMFSKPILSDTVIPKRSEGAAFCALLSHTLPAPNSKPFLSSGHGLSRAEPSAKCERL